MTIIRKPSELKVSNTIKALIYGQPGAGKSSLSLSSPSPLLFDFDGGIHRVNTIHQSDTVQIEKWEDIIEALKEDLSAYKTFVIDTAGKMLDYMSAYIIKNEPKMGKKDGALSLQGYGARKAMFQNFLKQITIMGKHIVFVAHDKEEKDGDTKFIRPEIGGSSGNDLIKEIDLVGYLEMSGKKRTVSFDPCEKFYGKNTCNLPSVIELFDLNSGKPNTQLTEIFNTHYEFLEHRKIIAGEYNDLLELIKETIGSSNTAEELNEKILWAKELKPIWDSSLQASYALRSKAEKMGLVFDKKEKKYVAN